MDQDAGRVLAAHIRGLRIERDYTLDALSELSGVSRASLSRIENGAVSPTADTLARIAAALKVSISALLQPLEAGFDPLVRREAQSVWTDASGQYSRRLLSPPCEQLRAELIEVSIGPHQRIDYGTAPRAGQEHYLSLLSGRLRVRVDDRWHELNPGDCLRYALRGPSTFATDNEAATYILVLV